ncbi:MAG: FG-GAP-like repeat-containing protein [Thermoanaerobaculia bacterium]
MTELRRRPTWFALAWLATAVLVVVSCRQPPPALRGLLVQGVAHAEVGQWADAVAVFQRAAELAPDEPVAAYDLAVAQFRTGDRVAARQWLERARQGAPAKLEARAELLRAKLAYEDGDDEEELAAHLEAIRLDPEEPAYHHALADLHRRLRSSPEAVAAALGKAFELWPENAFLAAEYALWALAQSEDEVRRRGLGVLQGLVEASAVDEIAAYFDRGREQLAGAERVPAAGVPVPLRAVVNLLRATKRFADDAAELQGRLEPLPLGEPVHRTEPAAREPSPPVRFEPAPLLPELSLAAGEEVLEAVIVDDAVEDSGGGLREAGIAVLSDRSLYVLGRRDDAWRRLGDFARPASRLLAGDIDDDEQMELVVLTATGVRRWDRGESGAWSELSASSELATAGALEQGLLIDFEHDGDLDLLATDAAGRILLIPHRGEAGWGMPQSAPLAVDGAVGRMTSTDLDGDHDQDLLLATGDELLILRNWRQGEFVLHGRLPLPATPARLLPVEVDGDGHMDVAVLFADRVGIFHGDGRARLLAAELPAFDLPTGDLLTGLTAADIDLDGDQDLLVTTAPGFPGAGLVLLKNLGGSFELVREPGSAGRGTLALDLDGDRDPDLLTWSAGGLRTLRSRGAEDQRWIALRLRAPGRKVPRDGRGVRLQIAAGDRVQWLEPRRPNVIVGLGRHRPVLVKATWPNGVSEYLFEPEAESEHTLSLQLRVEGSCPFLYASDGDELRFVTDLLGLSPVGMLAAPGRFVPADPEEYVRLPDWVRAGDGELEIVVTEELREVLYLDQSELVVVDAAADTEVYNGEQWLERPVQGLQLRLLSPLRPPESVLDHRGNEVLETVAAQDDRYLTNHVGPRRYQGAVAPHRLTVAVPPEIAAAEHPALVLVGWLHWGNTSTNIARSQDPGGAPVFPYLEVPDGQGGWRRTAVEVGLPAGKTKPVVVDLTAAWDGEDAGAGPRLLRITTDFEVYWDRIAVAALRPVESTPHAVYRLRPRSADLEWGGFSRWYRPAANGPYLFDYGDRRPYPWRLDADGRELTLSWQEHEGYYTEYGAVTELLESADDRSAVLGSGEELRIRFDVGSLPSLPSGWRRTYFLHSEGWEKDGDPNVACSRTVEPLPRRGVREDPCSGRVAAEDASRPATFRTRWVARDRLERRVETLAGKR